VSQLIKYNAACKALAEAKSVDEVKDIRDKAEAMRAYAHQAKNRQMEIDAAEIRIRAERYLGGMIQQQKETVGLATGGQPYQATGSKSEPVDRPPTLAQVGIDKKLSSHAQKVAAIPEDEFEEIVTDWRDTLQEANQRVTTNIIAAADRIHNHRAQGTGENEWYTPDEYLEAARRVLGGIDLDPASSEIANQRVKAKRFFTIEDDGLARDWAGKVWMNPPYSQPHIRLFAEKLVDEFQAGRVSEAIALTHNYTDTAWFHIMAQACTAICFTRGRIGFLSPEGKKAAPTQGQAFFYFGTHPDRFADAFAGVGFVAMLVEKSAVEVAA